MSWNDGSRVPWPASDIAAEASSGAVGLDVDDDDLWSRPPRRPVARDLPPAGRGRWPVVATILALVMGATALIGMREKIVRNAPATALAYRALGLPVNLAGLELRGVRSRVEIDGGRKVLITEGEIVNIRRDENRTPPLTLTVRDSNGLQRYAWTAPAPKTRLQPGETIAFRARLASPPEDGAEVLVRFARLAAAK